MLKLIVRDVRDVENMIDLLEREVIPLLMKNFGSGDRWELIDDGEPSLKHYTIFGRYALYIEAMDEQEAKRIFEECSIGDVEFDDDYTITCEED
jgi:hypothetical protein